MKNLIGKGITREYYFYFSNWGFYFSAGYSSCENLKIPNSNELNRNTN